MSEKLKILLLVIGVLGFISVISDSGPSLQQTLGIIIAVFILHFYMQKNFDDLQQSSLDTIKKLEKDFKRNERIRREDAQSRVPEDECQKDRLTDPRPSREMPAYIQNEQTDPFRQTTLQSYPLENWHIRNASPSPNPQMDQTCESLYMQNGKRKDDHLLVDQMTHDHCLYRDPAKNQYNQQKMLKNARFFEKHFGHELRRAEERVWFEDSYLC